MTGWQAVLLVLGGLFIGLLIPVSVQLWATLRSGQKLFDSMGARGAETLAQLTDTAVGLKETLAEIGELAHSANQIKGLLRIISSIGAAVGPAAVALVHTLREPATTKAPAGNGAAHVAEGHPTALPVQSLASPTSERGKE